MEINSEVKLYPVQVSTVSELEFLKSFLNVNNLPSEDISLNNSYFKLYRDSNNDLVGSGGLEFYGPYALLRSLAVSQKLRGLLVGKQIVRDLLHEASNRKIKAVYLLTNSAYHFFTKFGFTELNREQVPNRIKSASEFVSVCPTSAQVMVRAL